MTIGIRGDQDAVTFASIVRATVAGLDPGLALSDVQTIEQLERDRLAPQRFSAVAISGFGVGAVLLAAIGLYGVLAVSVSERRRDIAIRLALAAQRNRVLRLAVREGMTPAAIGLGVGAVRAMSAARLLKASLFETHVYDPLPFAACLSYSASSPSLPYLPARRAAAVDPIIALPDS